MARIDRRAALAGMGMMLVAGSAVMANPRDRLAVDLGPLGLDENIPRQIGEWMVDRSITPVLPSADVQDRLDKLYNSIFSRTYVNASGERIMFMIAYGADQADRMTLAHLPESCYSSQGFEISPTVASHVDLPQRSIGIAKLRTRRGTRVEPVTYWTTVGEYSFNEEVGRRWARARYAFRGIIPDGMLVRVSSINANEDEAFASQARFISQLYGALPAATRDRVFGLPT